MYEQFHALGDIDITRQPMEIYPTIHYTMGGIRVDPDTCSTTLPGLYAAGECAGGLHGANRLGGNSLTDILVFGRRAGEAAAIYASSAMQGALDEGPVSAEMDLLLRPLSATSGENPFHLAAELQEAMQQGAMIERTEAGLTACLEKVLQLRERVEHVQVEGSRAYNPGWNAARDLRFTLRISEVIVRCALARKESRGAQWRSDYPGFDPEWGRKNLVARLEGDTLHVETRPLPSMSPELQSIMEEAR